MKYFDHLGSLCDRAFRYARHLRPATGVRAALPIAGMAIALAVGIAAGLPRQNDKEDAVFDSSYQQAGLLADAVIPSQTPGPVPTEVAVAVTVPQPAAAAPLGPQPPFPVQSSAVAIWEGNCGAMLYGKNDDVPLPPASLTKMMTLLVALESGQYPLNLVRPGISGAELRKATRSSIMGLSPDMTLTYQDLYMGLMLPSGNDAAVALAFASGNYNGFVERMNARAAELGMTKTHFANPHGLDHPLLYASARDLLVLQRVMMDHPYAAWVVSTPYYVTVHGTLGFGNGNKLLTAYAGTLGGKTGFTDDAGHTIAVSVVRDGRRLDMVVLGSEVKFVEPMQLLDWAFNETRPAC